jgi:hypothetical protein
MVGDESSVMKMPNTNSSAKRIVEFLLGGERKVVVVRQLSESENFHSDTQPARTLEPRLGLGEIRRAQRQQDAKNPWNDRYKCVTDARETRYGTAQTRRHKKKKDKIHRDTEKVFGEKAGRNNSGRRRSIETQIRRGIVGADRRGIVGAKTRANINTVHRIELEIFDVFLKHQLIIAVSFVAVE